MEHEYFTNPLNPIAIFHLNKIQIQKWTDI